jgi:hypothetical protein
MASTAVIAAVVSATLSSILGGGISYIVSSKVAKKQVQTQIALENEQRLCEWYEQSIALVQRTRDDWWEVMTSGEKDYEIDAKSTFLDRRDELREHAARGQGLGADEDVVQNLQQAASSIGHAVSELDSGKNLAVIEKETLLPTLHEVEEICKQKDVLIDN